MGNDDKLYTFGMKIREIRRIQIKYARTPVSRCNDERMSTALMTKDLRLPCERPDQEHAAGDAHYRASPAQTLTCVSTYTRIFHARETDRDGEIPLA